MFQANLVVDATKAVLGLYILFAVFFDKLCIRPQSTPSWIYILEGIVCVAVYMLDPILAVVLLVAVITTHIQCINSNSHNVKVKNTIEKFKASIDNIETSIRSSNAAPFPTKDKDDVQTIKKESPFDPDSVLTDIVRKKISNYTFDDLYKYDETIDKDDDVYYHVKFDKSCGDDIDLGVSVKQLESIQSNVFNDDNMNVSVNETGNKNIYGTQGVMM